MAADGCSKGSSDAVQRRAHSRRCTTGAGMPRSSTAHHLRPETEALVVGNWPSSAIDEIVDLASRFTSTHSRFAVAKLTRFL